MSAPSEALQSFLRDSISSYEELEVLLLLFRARDRSWTDEELAEALKVPVENIASALDELVKVAGLLRIELAGRPRVQYQPAAADLHRIVQELEVAYADQRLAIVQLMSSNALARVRSAAARRLANAFRIERPKR